MSNVPSVGQRRFQPRELPPDSPLPARRGRKPESQQDSPVPDENKRAGAPAGSFVAGNIHLELGYRQQVGFEGNGAGYQSFRGESLSLDFSFLKEAVAQGGEEVGNRVHQLFESGAVGDFVHSFLSLDFQDDSTLEEYNRAVDRLFNELESSLGLTQEAFDYAQDSFKTEVAGFFDRVQSARTEPLPLLKGENGEDVSFDDVAGRILGRAGELLAAGEKYGDAGKLIGQATGFDPADKHLKVLFSILKEIVHGRRGEADQKNLSDYLRSTFEKGSVKLPERGGDAGAGDIELVA